MSYGQKFKYLSNCFAQSKRERRFLNYIMRKNLNEVKTGGKREFLK